MTLRRDSPYLLVVTVLNGRNFPQRPSESLRIDVRFDGQLLSSLPVPMVEDPVFDVDMAYRLTGAQLTKHKVQKTPIKVDVMKVNRKTKKAEKIGYKILDLRVQAVEVGKPRFTWFPLLGAQAFRGKPEIHLGVAIDDDVEAQESARSQKEFTRSARNREYWALHEPVLVSNPDGSSHYQLGPSKDSTHVYLFSVIIGYASNIGKFFDHATRPPDRLGDFFFHYEVVGNHLTSKPFNDFDSVDFGPERVSLRIRSYFDLIQEYFLHKKSLKIKLCQGDGHIVATAELMFKDVFQGDIHGVDDPVVLEKEVLLYPFPENQFGIPENLHVPADQHPVVGVSLEISVMNKIDQPDFARTLTMESSKAFTDEIEKLSNSARPTSAKTPKNSDLGLSTSHRSKSIHNISNLREDHSADSGYHASLPRANKVPIFDLQKPIPPPPVFPGYMDPSETESDHEQGDEKYKWKGGSNKTPVYGAEAVKSRVQSATTQVSPEARVQRADHRTETDLDMRPATTQTLTGFESLDSCPPDLVHPEATRRYVCTIFLYKIRIVSPNYRYTMPIYVRYQYPFFGSAAPIMTRPAVEVPPKLEVILDNNSLTQFSFGCSESQLLRAFRTAPLCLEVWRYGGGTNQDELIGQAKLRLDLLLRSESTTLFENDKPYCRRLYDVSLEVVDLQIDKYPKLGDLTICTTLDDYGPVQRQIVDTAPVSSSLDNSPHGIKPKDTVKRPQLSRANVEEMEKTAAFELEIWKEREEKKFKAQLKKREEEAMRNMSDEWDRRTKQQKAYVDETIQKYKDLEVELRKLILENAQKEWALCDRERRVSDAERFLKSEKQTLTKDIDEMQQNVIQEYSKRLELEHSSQGLLKGEIKQLCSQIDDFKKRIAQQDDLICRLQEADRQKPFQQREAQAEIDRLTLERNDMERRCTSVTESKEHYKQQWALALNEIAKMRDRVDAEQDRRMQEKDREIASLRIQLEQAKERSDYSQRSQVSAKDGRSYRERDSDRSCDDTPRKQRLAMQFNPPKQRNGAGDAETLKNGRAPANIPGNVNGLGLSASSGSDLDKSDDADSDQDTDDHPRTQLSQAMEERNLLLKTGIYKPRDSVIVELDKKIIRLEAIVRGCRVKS